MRLQERALPRPAARTISAAGRLRSLDVFRGVTVAAMILVNSPGGGGAFTPLRHADWNGWTPTDMIFPSFLVIMGVSAVFSAAARRRRGQAPATTLWRVLQRAAVLIALGLLVNYFIYPANEGLRLTGVTQRIALCYLGVEAFLLLDRPRVELVAAAGLLAGYWLLLSRVPVPGFGAGVLTPEGNFAYWLDRRLLGGHLLRDPWGDPEGLLSTTAALATALLGVIAGRRLLRAGRGAAASLGAAGLALTALGAAWETWLPLNKHLWTSSYAVFSGGLALAGLALCLGLVEGRRAVWAPPFEALGRRALAAYVLAGLAYGILLKFQLGASLFAPWLSAPAASLTYALAFTCAAAVVAVNAP